MTAASTTTASTDGQRAGRGRGRGEGQALRQDVGRLRHTPGDDGGGDRDQGECPGAASGAANEQQESAGAAGAAQDHHRQGARGETVEQVVGIGVEHEGAGGSDHGHDDGAATARRRKYSAMSVSSRRRASHTR